METPDYYRARQEFIYELMDTIDVDMNEKNNHVVILRNGVIPVELLDGKSETKAIRKQLQTNKYTNEPLSFAEITSLNTWFDMHPEKVAGKEKVTTSLQFPITIVGDEALIKKTLSQGLKSSIQKRRIKAKRNSSSSQRSIRLAEAEAEAIMMLLEIEGLHEFSVTQSADFKKWFGKSKVVDEKGEPLIVYHGTQNSFTHFNTPSWFTEDIDESVGWSNKKRVVSAYLKIINPYDFTKSNNFKESIETSPYDDEWIEQKIKEGYDGAFSPQISGDHIYNNWVAFFPTQIKSATDNQGTFDVNTPNILEGIKNMTVEINVWDNYTGRINDNTIFNYRHAIEIASDWVNELYPEKAPPNYLIECEINYYNVDEEEIQKKRKKIRILSGTQINALRKANLSI